MSFCKANKPEQPGLKKAAPMPKLEPLVPTDEQITAFLSNQKKMKANKKRAQMSNWFQKGLPQ